MKEDRRQELIKEAIATDMRTNPEKGEAIMKEIKGDHSRPTDIIKTLRDGTREVAPLVGATMLALEHLYETEPLALYDLRMMCDDRGYQPFGENGDVLKDARLLEPDGRMHDSVRNIVRNAVTVKDFSIGLRNPLKQEEAAP